MFISVLKFSHTEQNLGVIREITYSKSMTEGKEYCGVCFYARKHRTTKKKKNHYQITSTFNLFTERFQPPPPGKTGEYVSNNVNSYYN